ncbi:Ent-kaurenoic acid oxidase 2 [Camellia lanceoleosa]|uniref:Ent-kaurenoic acid oxidase 2 n=1 Tax=Camellia lanceoleosa TaxID=1840588 RepID=A0ACC0FD77_9ERIC|nr:Ent-kaurenoic acid oxidase 2 [Camellia lanceoleosa]
MYRTHLFGYPAVIVCSSSIIKFVLQSSHLFPYTWPNSELVGYNSLTAAQGERHSTLRRFVSVSISQPSALNRISILVQPRMVDSLRSWAEKGTVIAFDEVKRMTFENIGKLFISMEPGPLLDTMVHCFVGLLKGVRAQPIKLPGTAYHYALQDGAGNKLCDEEVIDSIIGLVVAGYEPTALASMWAIYYLAKFPKVLQKLWEENMAVSAKKNREFITGSDVSEMKYTNKVVEETLRLANISPFLFRSGDKEVEFQGYIIPKGWKLLLWLRYNHSNSEYFEDPLCFNPDRWNKPAKPGTFQVFGGGSRSCVGNMLSRTELAIFLHHLVVGYKCELINPDAKIDYLPHPKPIDRVKIAFSKI